MHVFSVMTVMQKSLNSELTPHFAVSYLGPHWLLRCVRPNTYSDVARAE